jgi:SAM-dependent methyltransferase
MFSQSAPWYDQFYGWKDYRAEAARLIDIVDDRCPAATSLLDVACGTGRHLEHLRKRFAVVEGADIDAGLLAVAGGRLPGVALHEADMETVAVGRQFDVVTCLFSSVGYLMTTDRLQRAVAAMAGHLEPGGLLIVEPWILPEAWIEPGSVQVLVVEDGHRRLVRTVASHREGDITRLLMHYVIADPAGIDTVDEEHALALFPREAYTAAAEAAGLRAGWDDEGLTGRGLLVAIAP